MFCRGKPGVGGGSGGPPPDSNSRNKFLHLKLITCITITKLFLWKVFSMRAKFEHRVIFQVFCDHSQICIYIHVHMYWKYNVLSKSKFEKCSSRFKDVSPQPHTNQTNQRKCQNWMIPSKQQNSCTGIFVRFKVNQTMHPCVYYS